MSKVRLMLKNQDSEHWDGHEDHEFTTLPRMGDLIDLSQKNDSCNLYRVVAVVHSQVRAKTSIDIYAVYIGRSSEVLEDLFKDIPVAKERSEASTSIGFTPHHR